MIKVGVFFGGASREREVSFAGGRTVYDNLDKGLFEAVAIFVDAYGHFVKLNWEYIYRGTIRDFFPPSSYLDPKSEYQIYSESLEMDKESYRKMLSEIGEVLSIEQIKEEIDFAFLALHGSFGEDGTLQGLLEWYDIPYSGSGVLASALGVSKHVQKKWWSDQLALNAWSGLRLKVWQNSDRQVLFKTLQQELGLPFVVKSSNQGSSIGVQVINSEDLTEFERKVDHAFFITKLNRATWDSQTPKQYIQELTDLRGGLGLPLLLNGALVKSPDVLESKLNSLFEKEEEITLQAGHAEHEVIFEQFIEGREFSCIVVVDDQGKPLALPPTEVVKGKEIFDYNAKYLPGLSHKQTPIQIDEESVHAIRKSCVHLFEHFDFEVYARIDGFINDKGIFLNDPNTTSGMMPSSFFFHQAAEIGLNPKGFITFILRNSIAERLRKRPSHEGLRQLLRTVDELIEGEKSATTTKKKVAVILGGYSTERHISVESGRNIYEKLASSVNYEPTPIFLTGSDNDHKLYEIPVNIMLKDNADDIRSKVEHKEHSALLDNIRKEAQQITAKYAASSHGFKAKPLTYDELADNFDVAFIALHGRPGEDGQVQLELQKRGVAFNGSNVESSQQTINKYQTNTILRKAGFLVADSQLLAKDRWLSQRQEVIQEVERLAYPLIAKPHDEGCSSAVIKIDDRQQLEAYVDLCFGQIERTAEIERLLGLGEKEEFPQKTYCLVESFTAKGDADHFLEITGGMLTKMVDGKIEYEVFEPSEALSSGTILSLAEKFLAGEGQNITPARFSGNAEEQASISAHVRKVLGDVARTLGVEGYCRIDAFVRIYKDKAPEVVIIEINSLPGMTPATCIYHQAAINHYKPFDFIDNILRYGIDRTKEVAQ